MVKERKEGRIERSLGSGSSDARYRERVRDEHQPQYEEAQDGGSGDQQGSVVRLRVAVNVAHQELKPPGVCGDDAWVGACHVEERVKQSPEENGQGDELQVGRKDKYAAFRTRVLGFISRLSGYMQLAIWFTNWERRRWGVSRIREGKEGEGRPRIRDPAVVIGKSSWAVLKLRSQSRHRSGALLKSEFSTGWINLEQKAPASLNLQLLLDFHFVESATSLQQIPLTLRAGDRVNNLFFKVPELLQLA